MTVRKYLQLFILKFTEPLHRYLLSCQANLAILGRYFCTEQQQLWRGSWNFKIIFWPFFTIIFNPKWLFQGLRFCSTYLSCSRWCDVRENFKARVLRLLGLQKKRTLVCRISPDHDYDFSKLWWHACWKFYTAYKKLDRGRIDLQKLLELATL